MKKLLILFILIFLSNTAFTEDRGNLYDLKTSLITQNTAEISLDYYKGHKVIVTMFYASCPQACPLTISKLKRIEKKLAEAGQENLRFLLISFDPTRDTSQKLEEVYTRHQLAEKHWSLTVPKNKKDVALLAAALSESYKKLPDGEFGHSSIVNLLAEDGNLLLSSPLTDSAIDKIIEILLPENS